MQEFKFKALSPLQVRHLLELQVKQEKGHSKLLFMKNMQYFSKDQINYHHKNLNSRDIRLITYLLDIRYRLKNQYTTYI